MRAQRIPVLSMASLRLSSVSWWYSWDPCEKLNLATFMPALKSLSNIGTDLEAGPRVHTILVFGRRLPTAADAAIGGAHDDENGKKDSNTRA